MMHIEDASTASVLSQYEYKWHASTGIVILIDNILSVVITAQGS